MKGGDKFISKLAVLNCKPYPESPFDLYGVMVWGQCLRLNNNFPAVPFEWDDLIAIPLKPGIYLDKAFNSGSILEWAI